MYKFHVCYIPLGNYTDIRRLLVFELPYTYTRTNDLSIKCKYDIYFADITKAKQNIQISSPFSRLSLLPYFLDLFPFIQTCMAVCVLMWATNPSM